MRDTAHRNLLVSLLVYGAASLMHFIHNAEFIAHYPGLPTSWTREGVYLAWLGMTAVGVCGWWVLSRGYQIAGLLVLVVYALLGLDSLGHYVVAPFSAHTLTMNVTILLEVSAGAVVLALAVKVIVARVRSTLVRDADA